MSCNLSHWDCWVEWNLFGERWGKNLLFSFKYVFFERNSENCAKKQIKFGSRNFTCYDILTFSSIYSTSNHWYFGVCWYVPSNKWTCKYTLVNRICVLVPRTSSRVKVQFPDLAITLLTRPPQHWEISQKKRIKLPFLFLIQSHGRDKKTRNLKNLKNIKVWKMKKWKSRINFYKKVENSLYST